MTTGAISGDRDDPAPDEPVQADRGPHPRPASRRGRADVRRRTPPSSPAYTGVTADAPARPPRRTTAATGTTAAVVGPEGDAGAEEAAAGRSSDPLEPAPAPGSDTPPSHPDQPGRGRPGGAAPDVRRRRTLLLAGIGALTIAGTALAVVGLDQVRTSTAGRYEQAAGPDDPGYQAYVVPTPTIGMLQRDADGTLVGAALLALESGDDGGSVVLVPPATIVSGSDSTTTLADVYRDRGAAAAAEALGAAVTVAVSENVEVDDDQWARLVEPVGSVELTLDQPVGEWEAGPVTLDPEEVGPFLAARGEDETDLDRVERQELFWNAWLPLIADEGEGALPGEVGSGIGRFVLGVARGDGSAAELPVRRDGPGGEAASGDDAGGESGDADSGGAEPGGTVRFRTDADRIGEFVALTVPYPQSATPRGRVRVRLLNGTHDPGLSAAAARALVASGAQISIVGNATSFDVGETSLLYDGEDRAPLAESLRTNLGGGRVEEAPNGQDGQVSSDDEIDVTVILGQDAEDVIGEVEDP